MKQRNLPQKLILQYTFVERFTELKIVLFFVVLILFKMNQKSQKLNFYRFLETLIFFSPFFFFFSSGRSTVKRFCFFQKNYNKSFKIGLTNNVLKIKLET